MKDVHGWAFPDADDFMARELQADGSYQAAHLAQALTYVTDWSLAIDGGAHVGTWSHVLRTRFDQVIAVEPSADTFEALITNQGRHGWANVTCRHLALGAGRGTVSMVLDGRGAELRNTGSRHVGPGTEVRVEAIDAWAVPSLGFLKLDVEGSEVFALMGARATVLRCRPIVLFEDKNLWRQYQLPRQAPHQFLTTLKYRPLGRIGCDEIWGPR